MSTQEKDFLAAMREDMQVRIRELKPLVDEFHRLEAAERALDGVGADPVARKRGPGRPRKTATAP